ncbi:hypothetical protein Bca4012_072732 [Brassica carinata]|uniref:Uncharacterized protein n=1 Tax=Brassica carinata TaxID=52824 RepID=A0A8X7QI20_BRACI|nr:hypothetical protein Bca52824_065087 [Brassica carinata]
MGSFQELCLMLRPSTMLLLESKLDGHGPPGIQMRRNLWQDVTGKLILSFSHGLTAKWYTHDHKVCNHHFGEHMTMGKNLGCRMESHHWEGPLKVQQRCTCWN